MLMNGFQKDILNFLEEDIKIFFEENKDDLTECEYLLPDVMDRFIKDGKSNIKVINTPAIWHGMTYKEDVIEVKNNISNLIEKGIYKKDLWS